MINRQMKHYSYSTFNTTKDSYGQHTLVPVVHNDILMWKKAWISSTSESGIRTFPLPNP